MATKLCGSARTAALRKPVRSIEFLLLAGTGLGEVFSVTAMGFSGDPRGPNCFPSVAIYCGSGAYNMRVR
jgi:hypothetical protein